MSLPHIITNLCLIAAALFPRTLQGQDAAAMAPQADSARTQTDITPPADTAPAAQPSDSTVRPAGADSAGGDTARAALDSVPAPAPDTTHSSATGTSPRSLTGGTTPPDSILASACSGPGASTSVARDLLVVGFTSYASAEEKTAAAQAVQGSLLGQVSGAEPGTYYLRVPSGGQEYQLRLAADKLAQLAQVKQVGSRSCPIVTPAAAPAVPATSTPPPKPAE
jgi:hypothetical protein